MKEWPDKQEQATGSRRQLVSQNFSKVNQTSALKSGVWSLDSVKNAEPW